jgi:hypothetical protein
MIAQFDVDAVTKVRALHAASYQFDGVSAAANSCFAAWLTRMRSPIRIGFHLVRYCGPRGKLSNFLVVVDFNRMLLRLQPGSRKITSGFSLLLFGRLAAHKAFRADRNTTIVQLRPGAAL